MFFSGDVAICHHEDRFSIHGRADDVINVNGHRVGPGEIEASLLRDKIEPDTPLANCVVVGIREALVGQTPWAFVTLVADAQLFQEDER